MDKEWEKEISRIRPDAHAINPLILARWSPRAILTDPVPEADLLALLEAAHWAPSCFNEQPWRFLVVRQEPFLMRLRACLTESNQAWANRAPVLLAVLSVPNFALDGRPNRWHAFDAGTAWGYLALEACRRGLVAHAMGGFSQKAVREAFHVPEDWGVHALVAVGYRADAETLTPEQREREQPTQRKPLNEIWADGEFFFNS
ncbi:MAG: nitroreductase [Candidatus Firestonebacteria bacterium]|nr:nitroreductase [Candidatus Firestonebacteria bacterium]